MHEELRIELAAHSKEPFPDSVEKGIDYGEVEPVLIDADIYGWAQSIAFGSSPLHPEDRKRLSQAADELERSISTFPVEARPYFERILRIARLALAAG